MPFWNSTKKVRPVAGTDVAGTDVAGSDAEIRKGKLFASLYMLNQFCDIKHIDDSESISNEKSLLLNEEMANMKKLIGYQYKK